MKLLTREKYWVSEWITYESQLSSTARHSPSPFPFPPIFAKKIPLQHYIPQRHMHWRNISLIGLCHYNFTSIDLKISHLYTYTCVSEPDNTKDFHLCIVSSVHTWIMMSFLIIPSCVGVGRRSRQRWSGKKVACSENTAVKNISTWEGCVVCHVCVRAHVYISTCMCICVQKNTKEKALPFSRKLWKWERLYHEDTLSPCKFKSI